MLPDAPPLQPGEAYRLTGSFPKPWQKLTTEERAYRSHIGNDVERLPLVPFERRHCFDAKDIAEFVTARQREKDLVRQRVLRENPNKREKALQREGKLNFPEIRPSLFWAGGSEVTVVGIQWASFTDDEIANYFRRWVKSNRPENIPPPDGKGRKLNDWRVALSRLGIMRALHSYTFANNCFPKAFKDRGEKHCYKARKLALKKFHELFPFLGETEKPISWETKGRRSK